MIISIAAALLVLVLVIVGSIAFRPENILSEADFEALTKDLFEYSVFPTAIFDVKLQLKYANQEFRKRISDISRFDLLSDHGFAGIPTINNYLGQIKKTLTIPTEPFFFLTRINFAETENPSIAENYVMFRSLSNGVKKSKMLVMIIVSSKYSNQITDNLVERIAQRESDLKKLEEVDQLKSEFLATLSHELKTPLVSIKGYLDLMASEKMGPLTEKQEKALRVSLKNTSHLNSVISSMLNFARMEAGKLLFDLTHQKIQSHLNDVVDSFRPFADSKKISLTVELENSLPMVIIDAELIHRVMINLIENALKFSPPETEIRVIAKRDSSQLVKVEIRDQGKGIPANKIGMLKTPFYQIEKSDTRTTAGIGLGLAIAEKILTGHGTSLTIESEPGSGTTVCFFLKVAPPRN